MTRPRRGPDSSPRPGLRIVPSPAPHLPLVLALGLLLGFGILLATASLHTMIAAGQRDLDRIDHRIGSETRRNQQLELKVAELESPARIVDAARADGMITPDSVTWLSPRPDGGAEESVSERPDPPDPDTGNPPDDGGTDVRAGDRPGTGDDRTTAGSGDPENGGSGE